MKTYTNFKKIILDRVFWLKYIFWLKFKVPILDLMLLPKAVYHLKGYTTVGHTISDSGIEIDAEMITAVTCNILIVTQMTLRRLWR